VYSEQALWGKSAWSDVLPQVSLDEYAQSYLHGGTFLEGVYTHANPHSQDPSHMIISENMAGLLAHSQDW
jgi:hypothetical protein